MLNASMIRKEIEDAIIKLKCNKSPCTDSTSAELLKVGGENMVDVSVKVCNLTLSTGKCQLNGLSLLPYCYRRKETRADMKTTEQ